MIHLEVSEYMHVETNVWMCYQLDMLANLHTQFHHLIASHCNLIPRLPC